MRDALSNVLGERDDDGGTDRILAAAFFRKRPLQAGTSAHVIPLAERKSPRAQLPTTLGIYPNHPNCGETR
jgi:hypothetical protein